MKGTYIQTDILGLSDKELDDFVDECVRNLSVARTTRHARLEKNTAAKNKVATTKLQKTREEIVKANRKKRYDAKKVKHERIAEVLRHTLKIGDTVMLTETHHNGPVKVTEFVDGGFACEPTWQHPHYGNAKNQRYIHGFNKVEAVWDGNKMQPLG